MNTEVIIEWQILKADGKVVNNVEKKTIDYDMSQLVERLISYDLSCDSKKSSDIPRPNIRYYDISEIKLGIPDHKRYFPRNVYIDAGGGWKWILFSKSTGVCDYWEGPNVKKENS